MLPVIVVTELGLLSPGERWGRLVAPLEQQSAASGLGRVLAIELRCAGDVPGPGRPSAAPERGRCPGRGLTRWTPAEGD